MAKKTAKKKTKDIFDMSPDEITGKAKEISTGRAAKKATAKKRTGRPARPEKRVPFTTSLDENNLIALKIMAAKAGKRPADVLNEILAEYFNKQ